ncbi:MAG: alpha/beta hydrolase [Firmicutes bacterium]|nr:alpha/beta hydrolase [Bacillota bacterium]
MKDSNNNKKIVLARQREDRLRAIPMVAGIMLTAPLIHSEKIRYGKEQHQYFLYFKPDSPVKNRLVVYLHAGGWSSYSPAEFEFICRRFSLRGYPTVSIGYRHAPHYRYPAQAEDVFAGFNAADEYVKNLGFDTDRVIVIGSSAGGHLGGVLVYDRELQRRYGVDRERFAGLASLGGIMDFDCEYPDATLKLFDNLFRPGFDRASAAPINMVRGGEDTRVLCLHSEFDPISNIENQRRFTDRVNRLNPGMAEMFQVRERHRFHCNLVAGIFFERDDSPPLRRLFSFMDGL